MTRVSMRLNNCCLPESAFGLFGDLKVSATVSLACFFSIVRSLGACEVDCGRWGFRRSSH